MDANENLGCGFWIPQTCPHGEGLFGFEEREGTRGPLRLLSGESDAAKALGGAPGARRDSRCLKLGARKQLGVPRGPPRTPTGADAGAGSVGFGGGTDADWLGSAA